MSTIGSWGLHTQVQPRFGARAIVERSGVSLLWDRSGVYGEADEQWLTDIDTVLPGFIERLSKLFQQGELLSDQDKLVTLRQGDWVCLANPRASYGYLYLDVYRQKKRQCSSHRDIKPTQRVSLWLTICLNLLFLTDY